MTVKDLEVLYDYGWWANRRLFEVIAKAPAEDFTKPVAGSYGSIRNTLVHVMSAEWGWLDRCGGHPRGTRLMAEDFPDLAALTAQWTQVEGWIREFLAGLEDADLNRIIRFSFGDGPEHAMALGEMMHHGANHGVHHRGQVALILREMGHTPGNFDALFYYADKRGVSIS